jgi:hypothetical protein
MQKRGADRSRDPRLCFFKLRPGARLAADLDADARHLNIDAGSAVTIAQPIIAIANVDVGIGMFHALRYAASIIADLLADLLGVGDMRKGKPHGSSRNANKNLAHG